MCAVPGDDALGSVSVNGGGWELEAQSPMRISSLGTSRARAMLGIGSYILGKLQYRR